MCYGLICPGQGTSTASKTTDGPRVSPLGDHTTRKNDTTWIAIFVNAMLRTSEDCRIILALNRIGCWSDYNMGTTREHVRTQTKGEDFFRRTNLSIREKIPLFKLLLWVENVIFIWVILHYVCMQGPNTIFWINYAPRLIIWSYIELPSRPNHATLRRPNFLSCCFYVSRKLYAATLSKILHGVRGTS